MKMVYPYTTTAFSTADRDEFLKPFDAVFDKLFQNTFPDMYADLGVGFFEKHSFPKVDAIDYDDRVEIHAEIPGLTKDEVSVEISENVLSIHGKKKVDTKNSEKKNYIRRELKHSNFTRSFTLGKTIDKDNLIAKFENGILSITLKKLLPKKPKVTKVDIE